MKKILFLMFTLTVMVFSSCDSDENDVTNTLNGTTWVAAEDPERFTLIFGENTVTFIYEYDVNGDGIYDSSDEKETSVASYYLNKNEITIAEDNGITRGVVSDNQMTLYSDGDSVTYYNCLLYTSDAADEL